MELDAFEVLAQTPDLPDGHSAVHSDYKAKSIKFIGGTDPIGTWWSGSISVGFPGDASDNLMTQKTEILMRSLLATSWRPTKVSPSKMMAWNMVFWHLSPDEKDKGPEAAVRRGHCPHAKDRQQPNNCGECRWRDENINPIFKCYGSGEHVWNCFCNSKGGIHDAEL